MGLGRRFVGAMDDFRAIALPLSDVSIVDLYLDGGGGADLCIYRRFFLSLDDLTYHEDTNTTTASGFPITASVNVSLMSCGSFHSFLALCLFSRKIV